MYLPFPKIVGDVEMGTNMSLDDWLAAIRDRKRDPNTIVTYQFPTDRHRKEYLATIRSRSDADVRFLLRRFLIPSGTLGQDYATAHVLAHRAKAGDPIPKTEFTRRLFGAALTKGRIQPWEGTTWILDLLPGNPRKAVEVLDAYFDVHAGVMSDGRLLGMSDARAMIRWKYILIGDPAGSEQALLKLTSRELEVLVAALYRSMGYQTWLTPPAKDGGRDVIATRRTAGQRERCLVECKHHHDSVGVKDVRALLGIVTDERATKGCLVSSSRFTRGAKDLAARNDQLELVPRRVLVHLLNENLGSDWPTKADELVAEEARQQANVQNRRAHRNA
jgi:restriction system protein